MRNPTYFMALMVREKEEREAERAWKEKGELIKMQKEFWAEMDRTRPARLAAELKKVQAETRAKARREEKKARKK